jgi:hypothetical protein
MDCCSPRGLLSDKPPQVSSGLLKGQNADYNGAARYLTQHLSQKGLINRVYSNTMIPISSIYRSGGRGRSCFQRKVILSVETILC